MKRLILLIAACLPLLGSAQYKSQVWCPDNGDGTYTNPVINADYSDPDVCLGASGFRLSTRLQGSFSYTFR